MSTYDQKFKLKIHTRSHGKLLLQVHGHSAAITAVFCGMSAFAIRFTLALHGSLLRCFHFYCSHVHGNSIQHSKRCKEKLHSNGAKVIQKHVAPKMTSQIENFLLYLSPIVISPLSLSNGEISSLSLSCRE